MSRCGVLNRWWKSAWCSQVNSNNDMLSKLFQNVYVTLSSSIV
jgi:hypothetical protein